MNEINFKEQVVIAPSGDLTTVIPLFSIAEAYNMDKMDAHMIVLGKPKIQAYAIMTDENNLMCINADFAESKLEFLGDLWVWSRGRTKLLFC